MKFDLVELILDSLHYFIAIFINMSRKLELNNL